MQRRLPITRHTRFDRGEGLCDKSQRRTPLVTQFQKKAIRFNALRITRRRKNVSPRHLEKAIPVVLEHQLE
jgi:hypothetical protein